MKALPPPVAGALVYVGIVSLGLLVLRAHFLSTEPLRLALLLSHGGDAGLRWVSCVVSSLLVALIWAHWRATDRGALQTVLFLGSSVLIFLTHFAVVHTLSTLPRFVLTPV